MCEGFGVIQPVGSCFTVGYKVVGGLFVREIFKKMFLQMESDG